MRANTKLIGGTWSCFLGGLLCVVASVVMLFIAMLQLLHAKPNKTCCCCAGLRSKPQGLWILRIRLGLFRSSTVTEPSRVGFVTVVFM
jgi:hypothetical protein